MNDQDVRLYQIFGWRGLRGPFFVTNAVGVKAAIAEGEKVAAAQKTAPPARRFTKLRAESAYSDDVVWRWEG
jgi:hypothetical protein